MSPLRIPAFVPDYPAARENNDVSVAFAERQPVSAVPTFASFFLYSSYSRGLG